GKCRSPLAPVIAKQPVGSTNYVGDTVTFTVVAGGNLPLSYQWSFNGEPLAGATSPSLVLTNVQSAQAGNYSVRITNTVGSVKSSDAVLAILLPPAAVRVGSISNAPSGRLVTIPVSLKANGNENALGFSLGFAPSLLSFVDVVCGSGATTAALVVNTNQVALGRLGLALAQPAGTTFQPGNQEIVQVTFAVAFSTRATSTLVTLVDQPIRRQLVDTTGSTLLVNYFAGQVNIAAAELEGDVSPRPNGDLAVDISDWVLIGRFAARLDYPTNEVEFQRADCAPRATKGDGAITVLDWVQAGRYAGALDPIAAADGPTVESPSMVSAPAGNPIRKSSGASRELNISNAVLFPDRLSTIEVSLAAQGDENALGLSLNFDPSLLSFASVTLGAGATGGTLNVNTSQASSGRLGLVLALPSGKTFAKGTQEIVQLSFKASTTNTALGSLTFSDQPVLRQVADPNAALLPAGYANATVNVNPVPQVRIEVNTQNITVAWPEWASGFVLQETSGPFSNNSVWRAVSSTAQVINNENVVSLPSTNTNTFYRLFHP
ncbi:MAG TPA: immunoglobulin domain-containing protein, partial [Clostridia bacterium]|nr:immunoglobulin domain-containing protein [Clostridia bacterium]